MFDNYGDVITIEELTHCLSVGKTKAYELINTGEIKGFKIGNCWRIPKKCLIDYITGKCYNDTCRRMPQTI